MKLLNPTVVSASALLFVAAILAKLLEAYGLAVFFGAYLYMLSSVWRRMPAASPNHRVGNALILLGVMAVPAYGFCWFCLWGKAENRILPINPWEPIGLFGVFAGVSSLIALPFVFYYWLEERGDERRVWIPLVAGLIWICMCVYGCVSGCGSIAPDWYDFDPPLR